MNDMQFGKRITSESYFNGVLKSVKTEYSVPELVKTKSEVMSEIIKCLELIDSRQTNHLTIVIQADAKTGEIKLITKSYVVDSK